MRTIVITNPTADQIQNRVEINAIFLKTDIERWLRRDAAAAMTDLEFASIIVLAIEYDCIELAEELTAELNAISGEGVRC